MIPSTPLLFCESLVSVKENTDRKEKKKKKKRNNNNKKKTGWNTNQTERSSC